MILKIVLKSDVWPGTEKCGSSPKLYNNDLKTGRYRVPKLPPLYVKHVCSNSQKTNHPNVISKIVLKSVLWHCSRSAQYFCIFKLLCFSLHPNGQWCSILKLNDALPIWELSKLSRSCYQAVAKILPSCRKNITKRQTLNLSNVSVLLKGQGKII